MTIYKTRRDLLIDLPLAQWYLAQHVVAATKAYEYLNLKGGSWIDMARFQASEARRYLDLYNKQVAKENADG